MKLFGKDKPGETGKHYEIIARNYLRDQSLRDITQNFRCRFGEIDLIMQDCDDLVFVEVKYRHSNSHGSAAEAVTSQKQKKIIQAARFFLNQHTAYLSYNCRFDVVAINHHNKLKKPEIDWIKNAFMLDDAL